MRVDCRERGLDCRDYRAFLDGVELFECFFADDEEGFALVFATDEWGKRRAHYPERTQPLQHRTIDGVLYREVSDHYTENVVEVRGKIELRKVRDTVAVG